MNLKIQVLYVDDEPDLLFLGRAFLERLGDFSVTTVPGASEALSLIRQTAFEVIISDYQMPGMNGIEFLRTVRSLGESIPFILFTGKGREEVVIQALNEGADFYLQKGGDPRAQFTELAHKVRQAVERRRLEVRIRDHERFEADIINFLPDATFAISTEGIVIAWNRAMEMMTGIVAQDIIGKGDYEYSLPFYLKKRPMLINLVLTQDPEIWSLYPDMKKNRDLLSAEITLPRFHNETGASFWFTASPLFNGQGIIVGAIESIREITENKRAEEELRLDESRLEALLHLHLMIRESESDIMTYALEEAVRLTQSENGYIAYLNEDETILTMRAWSDTAMKDCQVRNRVLVYPVDSTGLWGEPVRTRRPVITNDYNQEFHLTKGIPEGHIRLIRHLGVPIMDGDRIVAVVGVANKHDPYGSSDVRQLELLIKGMWTIIQRKHAEQNLLKKHEELQAAYEEIYAADEELRLNLNKLSIQGKELEERERQLNAMASNIPGVVYRLVVNPDGTTGFTYISQRSHEILGIDNVPSLFSEHFTAQIPEEEREGFLRSIQEAITARTLWRYEGQYIMPSGGKKWIKAVSSPMIEDGQYIFDGIIFDDTGWKQLDEFNHLLADIADKAPASITVHDADGTFLYANEETFRLHGYSREEFMAMNLHAIDIPESEQLIQQRTRIIQKSGPLEFEAFHFHKDGRLIPLHVKVQNIQWEGKSAFLSIATDLTERKRYEEALHEANQKLRLLTSLTRHDVLNQLAVVKGCYVLALEESDPDLVRDYISRAKQAEGRIEKMMEFSREYESFTSASSDWQSVFQIVELVRNEVFLGDVQVENNIPADLEIYADPIIRKVFHTLLENAVRHGRTVTRVIFSSQSESGVLNLICRDDGSGIPAEEKERIFDHGFGTHTGIGLFLSREILSISGLSIRETGEPGTGAQFEILVPNGKYRFSDSSSGVS